VSTMTPVDSGRAGAVYQNVGLTENDVVSYFDTASIQQWDSLTGTKLAYPSTDSVSFDLVDRAKYFRDELANGMSVIVKSSPDSRVFAVNVLGRNRSGHEPEGKAGCVDFVNRLLEKGTMTRNAAELSRDLAAIGANVTLYDNPWIPYDDRYTTRRFSFIKFETIDDYAKKGFHLLTEMILHPAFDSVEVGKVRQQMLGILGRNAGSPGKVSNDLLFETMFKGHPYSRPIMGTAETIGSITIDDLRAVHASQYSPENMVLSIVTSRPIPQVMGWVEQQFGRLVAAGGSAAQPLNSAPSNVADSSYRELASEQVSIRLGSLLPGADHPDATTISVASAILSERLYHSLREKQGLAYSVGASALFDIHFGWFYASIGTGAENREKALDGLLLEIEKLKFDGPTRAEVNRARNRIWGRLMSSKLSRINQAYYLGIGEYLERPDNSDHRLLEELSRINAGDIRRVATKYFCADACVKVSAGSRP
ncbi:MAG: M16 family metallopeptidase, partial [Candidatus Zixiibacteriota bacterium]